MAADVPLVRRSYENEAEIGKGFDDDDEIDLTEFTEDDV